MTPERWEEVLSSLEEAMALTGEARERYLQQIGMADADLRQEVASLLAADEAAGNAFLSAPAATVMAPASQGLLAGRRVGPYELIAEIGSGGMGDVYRARRADQEYQHEVAIKLVRAGRELPFVGNRLRAERQILASLQHPNIARLMDGGTTADGVPYIVMELIHGRPIDEYCNEHCLDVAGRLKLFVQVCAAVQYAHQRMVIHRDLKPTNILVTADGVPKLLDFGIAKVLEPGATATRPDMTVNAIHLLTPQYASPEQLKREPVTAASDVYALGVILYELLAGARPYRMDEHALRAVLEVEPRPPSALLEDPEGEVRGVAPSHDRMSRRRWRRALQGDLDVIVLMALRKDPERRYATVRAFAEDIDRHLRRLPIQARKDTIVYRLGRFVARYKFAVVAGVAILGALLVGIVSTAREARIARLALERAQVETRVSDEMTDYLESLFDAISPDRTGGKSVDPVRLIDEGQAKLRARAASNPVLRARMLGAIGSLYCKVGRSEACRQNLERALALLEGTPATAGTTLPRIQYELAVAYNAAGRTHEATDVLRRALDGLERLDQTSPAVKERLATVWYQLGWSAMLEYRTDAAISLLDRARALQADSPGKASAEYAATLGAMALAHVDVADRKALAAAAARLNQVERQYGRVDVRYFDALNDYAELVKTRQVEQAESTLRRVVDGYASFYGRLNDKTIDSEVSLADVLARRDKLSEARLWFQRSVEDYRREGPLNRLSHIVALQGLSRTLWELGDYRGAESVAHELYQVSQHMGGPTRAGAAMAALEWGHRLAFTGATHQALKLLQPEIPATSDVSSIEPLRARRLLWLGDCYREMGEYGLAEDNYDRAIEAYRALGGGQALAVLSVAYNSKALLLLRQKRFAEAEPLFRRAVAGYVDVGYVSESASIAAARVELAWSVSRLRRDAEARDLIESAGPTVARELAPSHVARVLLQKLRGSNRGRVVASGKP